MAECDYCDASFDDEDDYLDHLADSHDGELGAIDRRRVDSRGGDEESGLSLAVVVGAVGVVVALGAVLYLTQFAGSDVSPDGIEAAALNESGDSERLAAVEQFQSEGREHVSEGTDIDYNRTPPLSGSHYNGATEGGFYTETQPPGNIVHGLEHGAVVIYYDESAIDEETRTSLREFAATHTGTWRSVIVVPNPSDDPESDYVLTAWRHRLYMDSYDARTVHAFLSEFLGRGPENPVR